MTQSLSDLDPIETQEWLDALTSVIKNEGAERARYILAKLGEQARLQGLN